jgi:uncharacterized protein (DUF2147 family)
MPISKKIVFQFLFAQALLFGVISTAKAQADQIEGFWYNDIKDAKIQIYKSGDGKFYGKIFWLKEPLKDGKPRLDEKNAKEELRKHPILGLVILKGFQKSGETYSEGSIYDPQNGKTYDCKMNYKGKKLSIRGYIGISLIGRTTVWERAG